VSASLAGRPIAVFDSGVGGLTVFKAIRRKLPGEDLVYFGDTAHVPYGTKSPDTVLRLARAHVGFLARRGKAKCVVIACNTASAVALACLKRRHAIPLVGVIEPGVRQALALTRNGRIGVLGTSTTIASGAYQRGLLSGRRRVKVFAGACPLLVPLVEEGWAGYDVTRRVAGEYVRPLIRARVDTVILGCTHYPLLKPALSKLFGPRVRLVDSAEAIAREVGRMLAGKRLLRTGRRRGREVFYLTDTGGAFKKVARRFLGRSLKRVVKVNVSGKGVRSLFL